MKEYIREKLGVDDKEKVCFDSYRAEELAEVINTQKKIVADQEKARGQAPLFDFDLRGRFRRFRCLFSTLGTAA